MKEAIDTMRIAVPDYVSNSYFPAIAAVELGLLKREGVDAEIELVYPVTDAVRALRDGAVDLVAGAAHAPLYAFPGWRGAKLLAMLSQNMYWFLVVRTDLDVRRGALADLHGLRIGAAPGPDLGLYQALADADVDVEAAALHIAPVPGEGAGTSFGVTAARALADGAIDAFWANGMAAEVAIRQGAGKVIVDARRDGGTAASLTFPALMATQQLLDRRASDVAVTVRAVVRAQQLLRQQPTLAGQLGERLYPPLEASLITSLIERDGDFYRAAIWEEDVRGLNRLAVANGLLNEPARYEDIVAIEFAPLWSAEPDNPGGERQGAPCA